MLKEQGSGDKRFFEIVNWKKAQPKMKGGGQSWMKLYTSLLYHEGFAEMSSTDQMAIVALWLYTAVSGHHVLPADKNWLMQRIPLLKDPPNLERLAGLVDCYGKHDPFIKFCDPPSKNKDRERERERESRVEKKRNRTLTGSGEEKKEKNRRVPCPRQKERKKEPEAAEKPENPMESEEGQAKGHIVPSPAPSVRSRTPQRIDRIIAERFPQHWLDKDAESFGWIIVKAIGLPTELHNFEVRSEWGSFASWWCKVKKAAPALALPEINEMAVRKADYVRLKVKTARNKSAVWFKIMEKEMEHRGIRLQPARAGPICPAV